MADVVDLIGQFGWWQAFFVVFGSIRGLLTGFNNLAYVFLVTDNDHWCSPSEAHDGVPADRWKENFIPFHEETESYSRCSMYGASVNSSGHVVADNATVIACQSWIYQDHAFGHSVSNEWDLVCDRQWQKSLIQSSYMAVLMLGVLAGGTLADRFGRRIVIITSCISLMISSAACASSPSLYFFLASRVGVALGISGLQVACFSLLAETIGPKARIALNICYAYGWILGLLTLPAVVWLVRDWQKLQIVNAAISVTVLVLLPWVYESPRWLLSVGRKKDACDAISKIAKFNKRSLGDVEKEVDRLLEHKLGVNEDSRGKVSIVGLFRMKRLRRYTIFLVCNSFFSYIVYYGSARSSTKLGGNPYLNFAVAAGVECVGSTVSLVTTKYCKRIPIMVLCYAFFSATMVATAFTPEDQLTLRITIRMAGWLMYTLGYTTQFIYINELFPTVARSGGFGLCTTVGRLGATIEPWISILIEPWGEKAALFIYAAKMLLIAGLVMMLPETFGNALPDTLEEGELFARKRSSKKEKAKRNAECLEAYSKVATEDRKSVV